MSARRLPTGGLIDRSKVLNFTFDGRAYQGFAGDTLASALLGAGVQIVGRSFKYHRPRGIWGAAVDDANAIFDVQLGEVRQPNVHGATTVLEDGMALRSVNAFPSARFDLKAGLDVFSRFLPAGFYYKMFMWPNWHLFEPSIRRMAGLGRVADDVSGACDSLQMFDACDVLVVGGGPAGLAAAHQAAMQGEDVLLVDDQPQLGGSLVDEPISLGEVEVLRAAIDAAGGRIMTQTTAFGIYDHGLVTLHQKAGFADQPKLIKLRAKRIILASGAIDRPVVFANNDRPGVMSLSAAVRYLTRYGVLAGEEISIVADAAVAEPVASMFADAGAAVRCVEPSAPGLIAKGRKRVTKLSDETGDWATDAVLCSAGQSPLLHLWCQAGGALDWNDGHACFVPGTGPATMTVVGAAAGPAVTDPKPKAAHWPRKSKHRQWIDFQSDVTLKDVELAARENFASVEHLKRYTTLGMATDQGKTSNINGLGALADQLGKPVPEVGTTKFRPPYVPVPLQLYHGARSTTQLAPLKRSVLEPQQRGMGAAMAEYGGWLRAGWFGCDLGDSIVQECQRARSTAGIFDASSLGKIEVMGPDAAEFLNFIYYNTMRNLPVGRVRYGFMLTERGAIYDDGVLCRLGENHFLVSCSSSHVDGVVALLEAWRQDGHDPARIFVHDATQA